jgi:curved DNA-binding protein CbpA
MDYYDILGVERGASAQEIKVAYRKKALMCHPDRPQNKNRKNDAEKEFHKVSEAYQCLSNDELRTAYDNSGHCNIDFEDDTSVFNNEFEELLEKIIQDLNIDKERQGGIFETIKWSAGTSLGGWVIALAVMPEFAVPATIFGGIMGFMRGYTGRPLNANWNRLSVDTKYKILEKLSSKLNEA